MDRVTADPGSSERPRDLGPWQLAKRLGLELWQVETARERGLLPEPDVGGRRWSPEAVGALPEGKAAAIVQAVGTEPPIGANRAAERLAARTGLEIDKADVEVLAERGLLVPCGSYREWALYDPRLLDALDPGLLAALVAERDTWAEVSLHRREAAELLGWRVGEFDQVAAARGLVPGPFGRFDRAEVEALAADAELVEQVDAERLLGPDQAAMRLEVRRTDWDYAVAAGWIAPAKVITVPAGRARQVQVPLYRTREVDALRGMPGVDWEAVRAARPGAPSPLRAFAQRPPTRAQVVRRFVAELGDRYGVQVWAVYVGGGDRWELDWVPDGAGEPTVAQVGAAIAADPAVARYRGGLRVSSEAGAAVRWARAMLEPGVAVILDTETTDLHGAVCELAVIDAATGEVLLNTLVDPGLPITDEARWIHGIGDADVAGAPAWPQVLPRLLSATRDRTVLAYNAEYDAGVIAADTARHGLDLGHLGEDGRWACVMNRRSDWARAWRWLPLGGGHRALGDTRVAREVLLDMARAPSGVRRG
ncbi:MAG TPA: 3'-5' exonuclease [Actinomycetes bacterium]|nr:3'-5' exonuclease [Actinomycetes bacterium]